MKKQKAAPPLVNEQPLERTYRLYAETYKKADQRVMLLISSFLLMVGILAVLWGIKFPYIAFLGQYNGFVNWASFFIAAVGYYYYKRTPVVGYMVILLLFIFAYFVTLFLDWHHAGGPSLTLTGSIMVAVGLIMWLLTNKRILNKIDISAALEYLAITPAWFLAKLLPKRKI